MNCGICSLSSNLICWNCMNQLLLKYRIQQIDTDYSSAKYSKQINQILQNCINNNSYKYIKYGTSTDNDPAASKIHELTLKLAQQLLNVEIIHLKKSLLKKKDEIDRAGAKNNQLRAKIEEWKSKNSTLRAQLDQRRQLIAQEYDTRKLDLTSVIDLESSCNRKTVRNLQHMQNRLSQELILLTNIVKKDNSVYLSFVPILPVNLYIEYPFEVVNANLLNVCNFLLLFSQYHLKTLTFPVIFPREAVVAKINSKQKFFKYVEFQPMILNRNECYPLYLTKNLYDLSKYELNLFVKLVSCFILNMVIMRGDDSSYSMELLVNVGDLLWSLIIGNESSSTATSTSSKKESFLKIFWNLQKYSQLVSKIDINVHVERSNSAKVFHPSKTSNGRLANLDYLTVQLYRLVSSDVQKYRMENKDLFSTKAENWEVI